MTNLTIKEAIIWQANHGGRLCQERPVHCDCGLAATKVFKRQPKCHQCFAEAWRADYVQRGYKSLGYFYR